MLLKIENVDEYIASFPERVQLILISIRKLILENALDVTEGISYGMPAYKTYNKPLIYFAAYEKHIGIYALPSAHSAFKEKLKNYKQGKGSVQFPLHQPIPYDLIEKMIRFRVLENEKKHRK